MTATAHNLIRHGKTLVAYDVLPPQDEELRPVILVHSINGRAPTEREVDRLADSTPFQLAVLAQQAILAQHALEILLESEAGPTFH